MSACTTDSLKSTVRIVIIRLRLPKRSLVKVRKAESRARTIFRIFCTHFQARKLETAHPSFYPPATLPPNSAQCFSSPLLSLSRQRGRLGKCIYYIYIYILSWPVLRGSGVPYLVQRVTVCLYPGCLAATRLPRHRSTRPSVFAIFLPAIICQRAATQAGCFVRPMSV